MPGTVTELQSMLVPDDLASSIVQMYTDYNLKRDAWLEESLELRNYLFATNTTTTTNSSLPWKNKTTVPKLTQLRDNLHANYMSALFPNDDWLRWEAYSTDAADKEVREVIQSYMQNKVRMSNFRTVVSQLVYDYIDYGNAFADVIYVDERKEDEETGEIIDGYVGPRLVRMSPMDHVFNPVALDYVGSPKITRYIKSIGELKYDINHAPLNSGWIEDALPSIENIRTRSGQFSPSDWKKAQAYEVDGFGSLKDYYSSNYVELLEFEGTIHTEDGELLENYIITVVDRRKIVRKEQNPSWMTKGTKRHVGWRLRPDNLYAMGPLNNLVGMQYRLDHLENLGADALDLSVLPPIKVKGDVPEFAWGPLEVINIPDIDGDIEEMGKNLNGVIAAESKADKIMAYMEEFAGAPKQAMGVRTPGEKTAFEVQALENAAGRIFQEKVTNFEINLLEPILNVMLEVARRSLDGKDIVRVLDNDIGVATFLEITKEQITAQGKIRPIGARHFSARAQLLQNLSQTANTGIWPKIEPHVSGKRMARLVEDILQVNRFDLVEDNVSVMEMAETQSLANSAQQQVLEDAATPTDEGELGL